MEKTEAAEKEKATPRLSGSAIYVDVSAIWYRVILVSGGTICQVQAYPASDFSWTRFIRPGLARAGGRRHTQQRQVPVGCTPGGPETRCAQTVRAAFPPLHPTGIKTQLLTWRRPPAHTRPGCRFYSRIFFQQMALTGRVGIAHQSNFQMVRRRPYPAPLGGSGRSGPPAAGQWNRASEGSWMM